MLNDFGHGGRCWPLSHACRVETRPQRCPMAELQLNGEYHHNADGAQHDDPRSSWYAPDLLTRKREITAEPPPDAQGPRLDSPLPNNSPGSFKTSVSILSSLGCVPRSAKGARGSIITDTTPGSQT